MMRPALALLALLALGACDRVERFDPDPTNMYEPGPVETNAAATP